MGYKRVPLHRYVEMQEREALFMNRMTQANRAPPQKIVPTKVGPSSNAGSKQQQRAPSRGGTPRKGEEGMQIS